jgi:hypothetical protein
MEHLMEEPGPAFVSNPGSRSERSLELICLWLGVMVYLASFFLPAVDVPDYPNTEPVPGWLCAWTALSPPFNPKAWNVSGLLLLASGLINPLVLTYFGLWFWRGGRKLRRRIAIIALAFIPPTWIFLATQRTAVHIGHVAWIAGLLLMLGHEAILGRKYETS